MTPSELKANVEKTGSFFFTRSSMKFFGDTLKNFGVRDGGEILSNYDNDGKYVEGGATHEVWELYRKHSVKRGVNGSHFFDKKTFKKISKV